MRKFLNYLIWKVIYPLITFSLICYGIIAINNNLEYGLEIWRIARVFMWLKFSIIVICFLPYILALSVESIREKNIKNYLEKNYKTPSYLGITSHIFEIALLAWFGNITYTILWTFVFCASWFLNALFKSFMKDYLTNRK